MSILDKIENIVVMGILNDKGEIIRDFSFGTRGRNRKLTKIYAKRSTYCTLTLNNSEFVQ